MKLINKKLADKFINKDMQIRSKELSSQGLFSGNLKFQLQKEFADKSFFNPKPFDDAVDPKSGKVNRDDLKKKGFSDDDIDTYKSYKKSLEKNSSLSNNKKEIMNYFKGHDVDSLKNEYNKERDRYALEKESKLSLRQSFLAYRKHSENIDQLKKDMLKKVIDSKSGKFAEYKKELREYSENTKLVDFDLIKGIKTNIFDKLSFSAKELIPFFDLERQLKRGAEKDISKTIEQESKKDNLLSKLFKYKKDSKSTTSKAFDRLKSYFSTDKALKDLNKKDSKSTTSKAFDRLKSYFSTDKALKDLNKKDSKSTCNG